MIRPGSNGSGNMTRARPIERVFRKRLTVFMALGALWGCTMEEQGVQAPAVSSTGGDGVASATGGATARGGTAGSGASSGGASGNSGALAGNAGASSGGASVSAGTSGTGAAASSGGAAASAGTSGANSVAGSGGSGGTFRADTAAAAGGTSATGGTSGADAAAGSGGTSAIGGTSGTDTAAAAGGTSATGGTSGTNAAAGSGGTSATGGTSGRDAGSGLNDGASSDGTSARDVGVDSGTSPNWQLLWSDEFNLGANSGADTTKWNVATWEPNTVNGEKQKYTARPQNVFHDGQGHLVLRGLHDSWNSNGTVYPYTSGRLQSDGKFQFSFGRVEVRAKLPDGQGSFPAILLMGTTGNWPQCGEIGMMEQRGQDKSSLYCSTYSGASSDIKQQVPFPDASTLSSDFHVYALEWYSDHMVFFIDGVQVARSNFDATSPFFTGTYYLILDVAIGGTMGGAIDDAGGFPMDMVLDYVRVYSQ